MKIYRNAVAIVTLVFGLSFYLTNDAFAQISSNQKTEIDEIFKAWTTGSQPGAAVGIYQNGDLAFGKGYGMANLEYDIPIDAHSVFRMASVSKQFTAACIVLLSEQGKLSLEDPLSKFFPDFPKYAEDVTILQLLNHTSGIRDYLTIGNLMGYSDDYVYQDKDVMEWLIRQRVTNFKPGSEHLYSNSGYWLLGQIVEQVSGQNMADFARDQIFVPLGMEHTHFHNNPSKVVKKRASGYSPKKDGGYRISMTQLPMIGDGGIFTSIHDLLKWDNAYYDRKVLSDSFWGKMEARGILNDGNEIDYAAGLSHGNFNGKKTIDHGGAFVGFRTFMVRFPTEKTSIAVLCNRADGNPQRMAFEIAGILYGAENTNDVKTEEIPMVVKIAPESMEPFCGHYYFPESENRREIIQEDHHLVYSRGPGNQTILLPISSSEFMMKDISPVATVTFITNPGDSVSHKMIFSQGENQSFATRYEPVKSITARDLVPLTGRFYSGELDTHYEIKFKDGALVASVRDYENIPMEPIMKNTFMAMGYMKCTFHTDDQGMAKGFKLDAGRVKGIQFIKMPRSPK